MLPNKGKLVNEYVSKVFCGIYSKDGKFFINATQDRWLFLYCTNNGTFDKCKKIEAENVGWSILDVAFSPDNKHIAYSTWAESVYEYSLSEDSNSFRTLSFNPNCRKFSVFSLAYSNDGRELFGCANDRYIYVYDRECNQRVLRFNAHAREINAIAFADNNVFYSAGDDALCKVWDRRMVNESDLRPVGIFAGHRGGITYIDSRGDSRYLITNSKDQSIKLWDMRIFSNYRDQSYFSQLFPFVRWDYRWQPIPQQIFEPFTLDYDTSIMTYFGHTVLKTLIRSRFSPATTTGQRYIYTGDALGRLIIYDLLTGKMLRQIKGHKECIRDVSWHPFHPHIVTSSWDGKVTKWECRNDNNIDDDENEVFGS